MTRSAGFGALRPRMAGALRTRISWALRPRIAGALPLVTVAVVAGAGIGGLSAYAPRTGLLAVALLGAVAMVVLPRIAVIAALGALPLIFSISVGGQRITLSDIGLLLALAGWLVARHGRVAARTSRSGGLVIGAAVAGYGLTALAQGVLVGSHFAVFTSLYRTAMIGIPLAVGLALGSDQLLIRRALVGFEIVSCVLAAVWLLRFGAPSALGVNKNPGGQMMVNGAALLLVKPRLRPPEMFALLLLGAGILATESRGSLLGLLAGVVVVMLARFSHGWTWRRGMSIIGVGLLLVALAPVSARERLLSQNESGQYNADIRGVFLDDALSQAGGHLILGHGVGTYRPLNPALDRVASLDPHNVYVLELFEGGIPLLVFFVLLALLPIILLWRYRADQLVLSALVTHIGLLVHSAVDIYWVRGTPTMSWLMIGLALARVGYLRRRATQQALPTGRIPVAAGTRPTAARAGGESERSAGDITGAVVVA